MLGAALATVLALNPAQLKFTYQSFEGSTSLKCSHFVENELSQDLIVKCQDSSTVKKYRVHLWITRYERTQIPKTSFEILYWVTDILDPNRAATSTTQWIHLKEATGLYALSLSQGVDQDLAGLYLDVNLNN